MNSMSLFITKLLVSAAFLTMPFCALPALAQEPPATALEEKAAPAPVQDAPTASPVPVEVRELWTGGLYTSSFRVGVCFSAQGAVRGVLHLRLANGQVDVYHFTGSVKDNVVEGSHSSGHTFEGRLVSSDRVEGVISLKNGMNVKLEGKRTYDVPLVPEDCAPMPE